MVGRGAVEYSKQSFSASTGIKKRDLYFFLVRIMEPTVEDDKGVQTGME